MSEAETTAAKAMPDEMHQDRDARRAQAEMARQQAQQMVQRLTLVSITKRHVAGRRNLSNIVRVVSREWLAWIEHHSKTAVRHGRGSQPAARHGVTRAGRGIGCSMVHPTDKACSFKGIEGRKSE
jgi:hypothetical protein